MKLILLFTTILVISCQQNGKQVAQIPDKNPTEIHFYTSDSLLVFADLYEIDSQAPIILLFHQGGSNVRGEYQEHIIPMLTDEGYNILATDQRLGGQVYGQYNRTVAMIPNNDFTYCDAYQDMEAALNWVLDSEYEGAKILWGSSYSASLAIRLSHQYKDQVSGILAFSPASGGPMADCRPDSFFSILDIPLLLLRPRQEAEIESVKAQLELALANDHEVYIAENGTHGSSMLVKNRVEGDIDENIGIVLSFLKKVGGN